MTTNTHTAKTSTAALPSFDKDLLPPRQVRAKTSTAALSVDDFLNGMIFPYLVPVSRRVE